MEPIKFLMTDTGAGCTAACKAALEAKGVEVHVCEKNGAAALDALRTQRPQAVLLDAFMPELDAISVKQRYEQEGGHAQFYVTGAFQNEQLEQELLDSGFAFYFLKPFDETSLVSRVTRASGAPAQGRGASSDEVTVTEILHQIGVPAHIKGYQFYGTPSCSPPPTRTISTR